MPSRLLTESIKYVEYCSTYSSAHLFRIFVTTKTTEEKQEKQAEQLSPSEIRECNGDGDGNGDQMRSHT